MKSTRAPPIDRRHLLNVWWSLRSWLFVAIYWYSGPLGILFGFFEALVFLPVGALGDRALAVELSTNRTEANRVDTDIVVPSCDSESDRLLVAGTQRDAAGAP